MKWLTSYPQSHLIVAVGLMILTLSPAFAAGFYSGREVRDVEKLHNWDMRKFDWRGFLLPVVPMMILHICGMVYLYTKFF